MRKRENKRPQKDPDGSIKRRLNNQAVVADQIDKSDGGHDRWGKKRNGEKGSCGFGYKTFGVYDRVGDCKSCNAGCKTNSKAHDHRIKKGPQVKTRYK